MLVFIIKVPEKYNIKLYNNILKFAFVNQKKLGQRPRTGKLFKVQYFTEENKVFVNGHEIVNILENRYQHINLFKAYYYEDTLEGFCELEGNSKIQVETTLCRINIVLEPNVAEPYSPVDTIMQRAIQSSYCPNIQKDKDEDHLSYPRTRCDPAWRGINDETGWFGIGIVRGKSEANHGTLWRSAYQLGASFTFSVGARYSSRTEELADVYKSYAKIPFLQFSDWNNFIECSPYACPWVAVEMGGIPLPDFVHPKRAIYFLGCEDTGLPSSIVDHCHFHISIPASRTMSFNVATAGGIIMYDRLQKNQILLKNADISSELSETIDQYKEFIEKEVVSSTFEQGDRPQLPPSSLTTQSHSLPLDLSESIFHDTVQLDENKE